MKITHRVNAILRHWALSAAVGTAVLLIALAGLGFLITGFYIWLAQHTNTAEAAAVTGAVLLGIAIFTGLAGMLVVRRVKKPMPPIANFATTAGLALRLASMTIRRDPKKALILSVVAGAIAEYVLGERK